MNTRREEMARILRESLVDDAPAQQPIIKINRLNVFVRIDLQKLLSLLQSQPPPPANS